MRDPFACDFSADRSFRATCLFVTFTVSLTKFAKQYLNFSLIIQADIADGDYDDLTIPCEGSRHLSPFTVVYYQHLFRDLISDTMLDSAGGYMVGGPGCTIEIDESCFGNDCFLLLLLLPIITHQGRESTVGAGSVEGGRCGCLVELSGVMFNTCIRSGPYKIRGRQPKYRARVDVMYLGCLLKIS